MDFALSDILAARQAIDGIARRTPLIASPALTIRGGCEILLKLETLQPIGAFKIRGAAHALSRLGAKARERGVVCCSTGNHGRAVAYAAKRLGVPVTVCLSDLVPQNKVEAIKALGATVVRRGKSQDEAQIEADRLVAENELTDMPPFDHPDVILGQGTIALELLEDRPDLETLVVPLSGGGLIGGVALAAKMIKPQIRIIGVTMERGAAMHESIKAGKPVEVKEYASLADSLGGGIGNPNRWTFDLCRNYVDETVLVSEDEIYRGMRALFLDDRIVTEGGAAVGAAALLAGKLAIRGPAAFVISGQNVDMQKFLGVARGEPVTLGDLTVKG